MTESTFCFNFLSNVNSNIDTNINTHIDANIGTNIDKQSHSSITKNNKSNLSNKKITINASTTTPSFQFVQLSLPCHNINSNTTSSSNKSSSSFECITIHPNVPPLKKINSSKSLSTSTTTTTINNDIVSNDTDIIPGVYEGGLKVWECSVDICHLLAEQLFLFEQQQHGSNTTATISNITSIPLIQQNLISSSRNNNKFVVLEMGCGHALPSCFLLQHGLCSHFLLLDYNEFVLRDVTMSNVHLNLPTTISNLKEENMVANVGWISGDWMDVSSSWSNILSHNNASSFATKNSTTIQNQRVDCIVASETIYTKQHTCEMMQFLLRHLCITTGIAIIATKRYYFGCGGGTNELFDLALDMTFLDDRVKVNCKLDMEVVKVIDNGLGNIREIILVRCVPM